MKQQLSHTIVLLSILAAGSAADRVCLADGGLRGFVEIQGGVFRRGRGASQGGSEARVEDFEILDHPVTNAESPGISAGFPTGQ